MSEGEGESRRVRACVCACMRICTLFHARIYICIHKRTSSSFHLMPLCVYMCVCLHTHAHAPSLTLTTSPIASVTCLAATDITTSCVQALLCLISTHLAFCTLINVCGGGDGGRGNRQRGSLANTQTSLLLNSSHLH